MRIILREFDRHLSEAKAAMQAEQWSEARYHLLKSAEYLFRAAERSTGGDRERRKKEAQRLLGLAKRVEKKAEARRASNQASSKVLAEDGEGDPTQWIVSKPGVRFDDVAGLEEVKAVIRRRVIYPFQNPEVTERYKKKAGGGVLL